MHSLLLNKSDQTEILAFYVVLQRFEVYCITDLYVVDVCNSGNTAPNESSPYCI